MESPARRAFERVFARVAREKRDWGRVLDVGCGARRYENWLACTRYTGLDLPGNPWADVAGDAHALPFPDASFDTVLALHLFYTLREPERALEEMRRVLAPGGTLLATLPFLLPPVGPVEETKNLFAPFRARALFARFKRARLLPVGGALTLHAQVFFRATERLARPVRAALFPARALASLAPFLDRPDEKLAVQWLAVAEK